MRLFFKWMENQHAGKLGLIIQGWLTSNSFRDNNW